MEVTPVAVDAAPPDEDAPHWRREHFIPLRKADLMKLLADRVDAAEREAFVRLCQLLDATFHYEYADDLTQLKESYAPFNPDSITEDPYSPSEEERAYAAGEFFGGITTLLERANYCRLSRDDIQEVVGEASEWGVRLHIDFDVFERLEVFARGDVVGQRTTRRWQNFYRKEEVDVAVYQRLVAVFQLRDHQRLTENDDPSAIYLKLFKNIPKQDVDMLLPGARLQMTLVDHGKVIIPGVSGFAVAVAKGLSAAIAALFSGFWGVLAFLGFVGGTAGYGIKSMLGYLRTKDKYQLNLTRSLYYQNLDNNAGVLFRLLDEAEEQEVREALLAYALLPQAESPGWNDQRLDREAESFLADVLGHDVDFEVHDALAKLERLGCVDHEDGRWRAIPLPNALAKLDQLWDNYFSHESTEGYPS